MAYDDDDDPTAGASLRGPSGAHAGPPEDAEDGDGDDLQQDFRLFAQSLSSGGKAPQQAAKGTLRRGEKDFEAHGTRAQEGALEASRDAMHDVLAHTRTHRPAGYLRGWYFPDRWAHVAGYGEEEEEDEGEGEVQEHENGQLGGHDADMEKEKKKRKVNNNWKDPRMFTRDRVVVLDLEASSPLFKSMGRVVTGLEKGTPGWGKTWLLPEEALLLVERGSLDLWWPTRGLEDIFPPVGPAENVGGRGDGDGEPDYELGIPLSLQAAYSLLIGEDGERGKVSLEKYQVYANLRRTGYAVLRAIPAHLLPSSVPPPTTQHPSPPSSLWQWLVSLASSKSAPVASTSTPSTTIITATRKNPSPYGPLVKPGLHRSYQTVFAQLALIPRHAPRPDTQSFGPAQEPFRIHYHVWKSAHTGFTKSRPPEPDFRIAVVDARESSVPTLQQLTALLEGGAPWDAPPMPGSGGNKNVNNAGKPNQNQNQNQNQNFNIGLTYKRLKHGWRNAVVAVVDRGLVSYLRFGEMAFAHERLFDRFDGVPGGGGGGKGGKRGGGGRSGRGGRGGRGRGRGRGRGG